MKGIVTLAAFGICAAMLSGCTPVNTDEISPPADRETASAPMPMEAEPAEASPEPPSDSIQSKPQAAVRIDDDPRRLLGLDVKSLTGLLGAPRFTRRDPPAQLWRYRDESCILDLFLYEDSEKKTGSTVRHFEARGLTKTSMTARICLRALLTARQPKAG